MFDPRRFLTHSLADMRVARILAAALEAIEPGAAVQRALHSTDLPAHRRVFLLGIGKAAEPMARAAAGFFGDFTGGLVITKRLLSSLDDRIKVMQAGHPIPDERSLAAGHAALEFVSALHGDDLLVCLISGGGSALVTAPPPGVTLDHLQRLTSALLGSGAAIDEINILRRQLDRLKGGGLARETRAQLLSLILSDVMGDHLEAIASGPSAPDPTAASDALAILDKYGIGKQIPGSVLRALKKAPLHDKHIFPPVHNIIIGNNQIATAGAKKQAAAEGFQAETITAPIQGEAGVTGRQLVEVLKAALGEKLRPFCLIAGGETTVTIKGSGKGGRNQELALAAVEPMNGLQDVLLVSLATDGEDGPTDAAGAAVNGGSNRRAELLGMSAAAYLFRNDAYPFFDTLGDLLKPGYTGTNVNDLILLIAF